MIDECGLMNFEGEEIEILIERHYDFMTRKPLLSLVTIIIAQFRKLKILESNSGF